MYAIIDADGFQLKVTQGTMIRVPQLSSEVHGVVSFDKILFISQEGNSIIGGPYIKNASVTAEVVKNDKAAKVLIFKKKPRKGHKKLRGHRQPYSLVKIQDIVVGG